MEVTARMSHSSLIWDHPNPLGWFVADQNTYGTKLEYTDIPPYLRHLLRLAFKSGIVTSCRISGRNVRVDLSSGPDAFIAAAADSHLKIKLLGPIQVRRQATKRR